MIANKVLFGCGKLSFIPEQRYIRQNDIAIPDIENYLILEGDISKLRMGC